MSEFTTQKCHESANGISMANDRLSLLMLADSTVIATVTSVCL